MLSFFSFKPKIISSRQSKFSGLLEVVDFWGDKYIATGNLTQSGSLIVDVWHPVLKKLGNPKHKNWLILGLAGGSVARLISQKYVPTSITGVEIDPVMLELGREYLNLDKIPKLQIINADAKEYIKSSKLYDFILVDLYLGDKLPSFVYTATFIDNLKKTLYPDGTIVFNHLFFTQSYKLAAEGLIAQLEKKFKSVKLVHALTNILIICSVS